MPLHRQGCSAAPDLSARVRPVFPRHVNSHCCCDRQMAATYTASHAYFTRYCTSARSTRVYAMNTSCHIIHAPLGIRDKRIGRFDFQERMVKPKNYPTMQSSNVQRRRSIVDRSPHTGKLSLLSIAGRCLRPVSRRGCGCAGRRGPRALGHGHLPGRDRGLPTTHPAPARKRRAPSKRRRRGRCR